jgi:predicted NBD/HSP70 family sugar kinase
MKAGTPEFIGEMNKNLILKLLKNNGPLSRAEISRMLNMSFPTVSSNVKFLIENGFINEIGEGSNSLGRKSTLLEFNGTKGYILGADFGRNNVRAKCADLSGEIIGSKKTSFSNMKEGQSIDDFICEVMDEVLNISNIRNDDIVCICIGIPGVIDENQGKNRLAPFLEGWENLQLKKKIQERFNTVVMLENTVNLGAIGEKWTGIANGYKNILYLNHGIGIGAALIINGELYMGSHNVAGEVGYMTLDRFFLRRNFSDEGSLEELISENALRKKLQKLKNNNHMYTGEEIFLLAESNDVDASKVVDEAIVYLGMALVNIISVIDPEVVILSGGIGKHVGEKYKMELADIIGAHVPYVPELLYSELGGEANVLGAIALALRYASDNCISLKK